ncbi:transcription antitermination factor NusB [Hyphobacterium marinum]|uniref:Transcription antitermination protein NusB n=1 Tax=Hyphobacterium marinum TaxID=3116574 RepID=A0ABU7LYZ0_9PROT|nr:transcription antitermination factor NusB [Hyphobacterium sp. Y6023]MEE2566671.1 transcription antitermination factor NusB [Hyphobacterium sp. Y6023]
MSAPAETDSARRARRRGAARLAAVQALYQMDMTGRGASGVIAEFHEARFDQEGDDTALTDVDTDFFDGLVSGVVKNQRDIDGFAAKSLAKNWKLDRIDATLRAILRAANYELLNRADIPARVIIDEYVAVAAAFFDGPEPKFVNAALDGAARRARQGELAGK